MGSKNSKIATSPKPRVEGEDGADGAGSSKGNHHGETSLKTSKTDPKSSKRKPKRKVTLDPQVYRGKDVLDALKAEETLWNDTLDIKSKLTQSMKSLRSDASDSSVELIDHEAFQYPFENVIFEGGGNKGLAYTGAIRELERVGIWKNVKRLGGASAGAMTATLMAIGYDSCELKEFLSMNLQGYFLDATCASCSLLPNLLKHFGWHPARRLFEWFGDRLEEKTGDADITFKQLYDQTGKELCIVVTNLNHMDAEYCHVKTSPNLPIRTAVRMSLAMPGLFGAVKSETRGISDYYVDGGVLCNYPLHCYDGWWLSMKPGDSMLRRLQPLEDIGKLWDKKERFGTVNPKTIGIVLYSSDEQDVMVSKLQKRKVHNVVRPDTKLSKERKAVKEVKDGAVREHAIITAALSGFLRLLAESDVDESGTITRKELVQAFDKEVDYFTEGQCRTLFGENYKVNDIFDSLNHDGDDEITYEELQAFTERRGVAIQTNFEGYGRREIKSFSQFLGALTDTLLVNVKRIFTTDDDISRTIGIDTVYVDTTDFELEEGDIEFLFEQGVGAVRSYLRNYVRLHDPPLRKELQGGSVTESTIPYKEPKQQLHNADPDPSRESKPGSPVLSRTNLHMHTLGMNATSQEPLRRAPSALSSLDGGPPILVIQPTEDARIPSPAKGDVTPKGSRRSSSARNSTSPSPSPSPRANDGEQLVRVRRGTRTPKDLSNDAFTQDS